MPPAALVLRVTLVSIAALLLYGLIRIVLGNR
jgi:hypothetical protein